MGYVTIDRVSLVSPSDHEQIRGHFGLTSGAGLVVDQLRERVRRGKTCCRYERYHWK